MISLIIATALFQAGTKTLSPIDQKVESLLSQMTVEEKVSLVHGVGSMNTMAIPRLGIPEFRFTDGPNGVRDEERLPTTAFPPSISMAASWNPELVKRVGAAIGQEAKGLGKSVQLGPAVNIDRTPLGGRTFEYFSEDPFLASRMAVGYIQGLQDQGVIACVKHFAANSVEQERGTVDAQVDERTLREIYLPAFEAAIKEGKAGSVMSAYNKLNGLYCSENPHLLKEILKDEWGFKGFVMSDWGAVHSTIPTALNGLDLEMPGGKDNYLDKPLLKAIQDGKVPISTVDEMVRRMLRTMLGHELPQLVGKPEVSTQGHQDLARELSEQAMVLLKNEGQLLPLHRKGVRSIAVIGPNADTKHSYAGGSGAVFPPFEVTPLQGIRDFCGDGITVNYAPGYDFKAGQGEVIGASVLQTPDGKPGLEGHYYDNIDFKGEPKLVRVDPSVNFNWNQDAPGARIPRENFSVRWTGYLVPDSTETYELTTASDDGSRVTVDGKVIVDNWGPHGVQRRSGLINLEKGHRYAIEVEFTQGFGAAEVYLTWQKQTERLTNPWIVEAVKAAKASDVVILCVGINHSYDGEGSDKPNMKLMNGEDGLIREVLKANPRTVIVLVNGTPLEMPWIDQAHAVLEAWYPGMEGGHAITNVLFGNVNPSGKLPITFPKRLEDSPAHANGNYPPKDNAIKYDEGLLVGYRYFDTKNVAPLFPFGFGLSYTNFAYSKLKVVPEDFSSRRYIRYSPEDREATGATVTISVKNTGAVKGSEVVQVYVSPKGAKVMRPEKELKGFQKVELAPGETKEVMIHLNRRAFAYYSVEKKDWVVDSGSYEILVGSSSGDIRQKQTVAIKGW